MWLSGVTAGGGDGWGGQRDGGEITHSMHNKSSYTESCIFWPI